MLAVGLILIARQLSFFPSDSYQDMLLLTGQSIMVVLFSFTIFFAMIISSAQSKPAKP